MFFIVVAGTLEPDRRQNLIDLTLCHAPPLQKISSEYVHNFWGNLEDRQTEVEMLPWAELVTGGTYNIY